MCTKMCKCDFYENGIKSVPQMLEMCGNRRPICRKARVTGIYFRYVTHLDHGNGKELAGLPHINPSTLLYS